MTVRAHPKLIRGSIVLLAGVVILVAFWPFFRPKLQEPMACTQEAMLCPDGSYVGRTGPQCAFAPCPNNDLWKTKTDSQQGISFQYPDHLLTAYISAQEWPPIVTVENRPAYPCPAGSREADAQFSYCIQTKVEGAAGSTYTTYTYSTGSFGENKTVILTFTLRAVQCANYNDPQKTECFGERETFGIDELADRIMRSITFR